MARNVRHENILSTKALELSDKSSALLRLILKPHVLESPLNRVYLAAILDVVNIALGKALSEMEIEPMPANRPEPDLVDKLWQPCPKCNSEIAAGCDRCGHDHDCERCRRIFKA